MRRPTLLALSAALLALVGLPAGAGAQEVPGPASEQQLARLAPDGVVAGDGTAGASGVAALRVGAAGELEVTVTTYGIEDVAEVVVGLGAPGEAGPVAATVPLRGPVTSALTRSAVGGVVAQGVLTDADVAELPERGLDGTVAGLRSVLAEADAHVEVRSSAAPDGAVRGALDEVAGEVRVNGTFSDDDFRVLEGSVEVLAATGVTGGCATDGRFCPTDVVTRGQLATFIAATFALPAGDDAFPDDDGGVNEAGIDAVAAAGLTVGCTPTSFCGGDPVTRGQVGSLLARLLDLPAAEEDAFDDDDGGIHERGIDALAAAGLTAGCAPDRYCPSQPLPRDQASALLVRAVGLAPVDVANVAPEAGIVAVQQGSVDGASVVDEVRGRIEAAGPLTLVAEVDHAANAASVDLSLPEPTTTFLFGNPALGTPLMQAAQTAAIDLPQKIFVGPVADAIEADYNDPAYVAARHGITGQDERLAMIDGALGGLAGAGADDATVNRLPSRVDRGAGLVTVTSADGFDATVDAVRGRLEGAPPISIVAEVDHAAAAAGAGLELRPTTLFVFGNPALGTPLMQGSLTTAIDLPQKLLVWQDADGSVNVTWNDPVYVAERHGIPGQEDRLAMIAGALRMLATGG